MTMRLAALVLCGLMATGHARAETAPLKDATMALPSTGLPYALVYIADAQHLWEKHGLNLKTVQIAGIGATNAVISGSVDFAHASGPTLARAAAKGQKLLAIFSVLDRVSTEIVLRKSAADAAHFDASAPLLDRVKILRGKTIAINSVNSVDQAFLQLLARRAGYDPQEIRLAVMPADSALAAFSTNQIDGLAMSPPWPQSLVLDGRAVTIASGPSGEPADLLPIATTIVLTKPETCAQREALCEGVAQAMKEAGAILRDKPEIAVPILTARLNMDAKLIEAVVKQQRLATPNPPVVSQTGLQHAEHINVEAGLMKEDEMLSSYDGLATDKYVK
jgi:NitT/TauT family transport system substrate-binding protein